MECELKVNCTPKLAELFKALDSVLPEGEKAKDLFNAFSQDVNDLIYYLAGKSGADLSGEKVIITLEVMPDESREFSEKVRALLKAVEAEQEHSERKCEKCNHKYACDQNYGACRE